MSIKSVVRGNAVKFLVEFYDYNNAPVVPSSANIKIKYAVNKVSTTDTLSLQYDSSLTAWFVEWDTTGKDLGTIDWHAYTVGSGDAAVDGQLVITGNGANV